MTHQPYFVQYSALVSSRIAAGKTKLYEHQKKALLLMLDKATRGELDPDRRSPNSGAGFLAMGVGTGKSVVISCLPYVLAPYMQGRQVIIVVENCTLRSRILQDFPTDARHCPIYAEWPLYSLGILPPGVPPPQIAELRAEDWKSYAFNLDKADLLVVNRQFLLNMVNRGDIDPANIGLVICDEAHHSSANSYRTIFSYLNSSMLVFLSGSRFRSDSKPLPYIRYEMVEDETENGATILRYSPVAEYEFSLQDAWKLDPAPIKRIMLEEATSQAFLIEEADGSEVEYSPETFFTKAESDREWFRHILLADRFCLPVLEQAVAILLEKRRNGQPHKMIVRGLNIPHIHRLCKLLETFPMLTGKVGLVHSDKEGFDLAGRPSETYNKFFSGEYICLVHCSMVGEGFNDPWASVSVPLCVMRSLTVAEQEFGRIIRKVPGRPPGKFPDLTHENWGVVVTHEMLGIREIFEKFIQGVRLAPLSGYEEDWVNQVVEKPQLMTEYTAGETTLTLNNTQRLSPGDVIVLSTTFDPAVATPPKFNLTEELRSTSLNNNSSEELPLSSSNQPASVERSEPSSVEISSSPPTEPTPVAKSVRSTQPEAVLAESPPAQPSTPSTEQSFPVFGDATDKAVEAIANHLNELRSTRTVSVRVEAVLTNNMVQITPILSDLPAGTDVVKKFRQRELTEIQANFINHIGLDWTVLFEGKSITFSEYRRRVVLRKHNLDLDESGEIVNSQGMRLRDAMPESAYSIFLNGLESEIENTEIQIPLPAIPCRPDEVQKSLQQKYNKRISAAIFDLLDATWLVPDGRKGRSLIVKPVPTIAPLMAYETDDGYLASILYKNNAQLLHKAAFAYIKEITKKKWGGHDNETDYKEAYQLAKKFLSLVKQELELRYNSQQTVSQIPNNSQWSKWKQPVATITKFSIVTNQETRDLVQLPTSIAKHMLSFCGVAHEQQLELTNEIIPALRDYYRFIQRESDSFHLFREIPREQLLSNITAIGKKLHNQKITIK